jgi:hypothetical protein
MPIIRCQWHSCTSNLKARKCIAQTQAVAACVQSSLLELMMLSMNVSLQGAWDGAEGSQRPGRHARIISGAMLESERNVRCYPYEQIRLVALLQPIAHASPRVIQQPRQRRGAFATKKPVVTAIVVRPRNADNFGREAAGWPDSVGCSEGELEGGAVRPPAMQLRREGRPEQQADVHDKCAGAGVELCANMLADWLLRCCGACPARAERGEIELRAELRWLAQPRDSRLLWSGHQMIKLASSPIAAQHDAGG